MNKRKDLLDNLKMHALSDFGKQDMQQNKICELLQELQKYYMYKDIETGSIHYKIFTLLYLDAKNYSYDEIAAKCNINVRTLDRYRQGYNLFASRLIFCNSNFFSIGHILADKISKIHDNI